MSNDKIIVPIFISITMVVGFTIGALLALDYIKMMCIERKSFRIWSGTHYSCEVVR